MPFISVLFSQPVEADERPEPPFFADLNLDRVFSQVAAGRQQYDLAPFFRIPLRYKELEPGKSSDVRGWQDRATAERVIKEALTRAGGPAAT